MYLEHFDLTTNPFSLSPKLDFLFKSTPFEESIAHLLYGVDNSEAIILITGAIGTGKTMAIQSFLSHLGANFDFALVTNTRVDAKELLKLVLEDLGVPVTPYMDKSDLLILFKDYLIQAGRTGKKVMIVIDEAQNLDYDGLEEVRLLTNLGQGDAQPVQIVLLGQPELVDTVNQADLTQLRQRIRVHYHLGHLTRQEVDGYITHRMKVAGCDRKVFSNKALDRVFELSEGVPRVINTLAGEALLSAFVDGRKDVRPQDVGSETHDGRDGLVRPETSGVQVPPLAVPDSHEAPSIVTDGEDAESPHEPPVMAIKTLSKANRPAHGAAGGRRNYGYVWAIIIVLAAVGILFATGNLDTIFPTSQPTNIPQPVLEPVVELSTQEATARHELPAPVDSLPTEQVSAPDTVEIAADSMSTPEPVPVAESGADALSQTHYGVHVSSFKSEDRAIALVAKWKRDGYSSFIRTRMVNGNVWHRVYLGPFLSVQEARDAALDLKAQGRINYFMVSTFKP